MRLTLYELSKQSKFLEKSLKKALNRARKFNCDFQVDKVKSALISVQISSILINEDWQKDVMKRSTDRDEFYEKMGIIMFAAANYHFDTFRKFGRASIEKAGSLNELSLKSLMIHMATNQISPSNISNIIYWELVGTIPEETIEYFTKALSEKLIDERYSNIYSVIELSNYVFNEDRIKFAEFNVAEDYFDRYTELDDDYQEEFWKWVRLKYFTDIIDPVKEFFSTIEDIRTKDGSVPFRRLVQRRKLIISRSDSEYIDLYFPKDFNDEIVKLEEEINHYYPDVYKLDKLTNEHHIIFPKLIYRQDQLLNMFKDSKMNRVQLVKSQHIRLHTSINRSISNGYIIPILTPTLIQEIDSVRKDYEYSYQNFLGLIAAVCEVAYNHQKKKDPNDKSYYIIKRYYDFLDRQKEYITPSFVKP